jgi:hypothetical protein
VAGQGPLQFFDALAGYGGDGVELQLLSLHVSGQLLQLVGIGGVDLDPGLDAEAWDSIYVRIANWRFKTGISPS